MLSGVNKVKGRDVKGRVFLIYMVPENSDLILYSVECLALRDAPQSIEKLLFL